MGLILSLALPGLPFAQAAGEPKINGLYRITKISLEEAVLAAESLDTNTILTAVFTFDPLPSAAADHSNAKSGNNARIKRPKARKPQADKPQKFAPSHDCKRWVLHVNWAPRVGDKMKIADAGNCHLKGSFAGR